MNRRRIIANLGGVAAWAVFGKHLAYAKEENMESNLADVWAAWKLAHLDGTGRVIDRMQQDSSHSEGQAYGMLLAATMGDRPAFDRIEAWTKVNLAIRADHLTAWRWLPEASERVPDMNNASDGDLFRAWALLKASEKFSAPQYRDLAQLIVSDLIATCIVERDGVDALPLLLPAAEGFRTASGFIINPCYSMPLAMTELATALDQPILARAARGAVDLMEKLAQNGLVSDWVEVVGDAVGPATSFSYNAGYEAIRAPLFLIWSGHKDHPAVRRFAQAQMRAPEGLTATVIEHQTGEILETSPHAGYKSIAALSLCTSQDLLGSQLPPFVKADPYYPATLQMFAMIAQSLAAPRCFPV